MKIEVGKYYLTRKGKIAGPMKLRDVPHSYYQFEGAIRDFPSSVSRYSDTWTGEGKNWVPARLPQPGDLVSECNEHGGPPEAVTTNNQDTSEPPVPTPGITVQHGRSYWDAGGRAWLNARALGIQGNLFELQNSLLGPTVYLSNGSFHLGDRNADILPRSIVTFGLAELQLVRELTDVEVANNGRDPLKDFVNQGSGLLDALETDRSEVTGDTLLASGLTLRDHLAMACPMEAIKLHMKTTAPDASFILTEADARSVFDREAQARYAWADSMLRERVRSLDAWDVKHIQPVKEEPR